MVKLVEDFKSKDGRKSLEKALRAMVLVKDSAPLAEDIAEHAEVVSSPAGAVLIKEGGTDSDMYFVLEGRLQVIINKREYALLGPGAHFGEFSLIDPSAVRSATVKALDDTVTAKLSEAAFAEISADHPALWRRISETLGAHLRETNRFLRRPNPRPNVLVCASPMGLLFAQAIQTQAQDDGQDVPDWLVEALCPVEGGQFHKLEEQFQTTDLGVIVIAPDEFGPATERHAPSGRDALFLCCGISVGALSGERTFIVEPEYLGAHSPAASLGLSPLTYRLDPPEILKADLDVICGELRGRIQKLGSR